MNTHHVKKGSIIKSLIESRIWIDIDEIFIVEGIIYSKFDNKEGVLFIDRNGGERVFWDKNQYQILS